MGEESVTKLDVIKADNKDVTQRCSAMFNLWRQIQPEANWDQLIRALKKVKLNAIADTILKSLIPPVEKQHTDNQEPEESKYVIVTQIN